MASSPLQDLQKVRLALVELRRREAAAIASGSGELPTYAAGILNTTNWIGAVDKAIEDESKLASALGGEVAVAGKQQEVVRVQSKARPSRRNAAPLAATGMPLAVAEVPDAQAKTNTLPPKLAPAGVAKLADKSRAALVVKKVVVVQKKAAQVEHHQRSHSGTYVQNGGWGWSGGGWTGYSSFSNSRSF